LGLGLSATTTLTMRGEFSDQHPWPVTDTSRQREPALADSVEIGWRTSGAETTTFGV